MKEKGNYKPVLTLRGRNTRRRQESEVLRERDHLRDQLDATMFLLILN